MNLGNLNFMLAAIITYIGYALKSIPQTIFGFIKSRIVVSIGVNSQDRLAFKKLARFLLKLDKAKVLRNNTMIDDVCNLTLSYGNYMFMVDKITIMVVIMKRRENADFVADELFVYLYGVNKRKYIEEFKQFLKEKEDLNTISVSMNDRYIGEVNKRKFNTIFFEEKRLLINYLNSFKNNIDLYHKFGFSAKTGILLYGEPGSGKSSLGKIIASYMNWDLTIINLASFSREIDFQNLVQDFCRTKENVIMFEDIDTTTINRENNEKNGKDSINLASILNFLDGTCSPDKVIFIATTNYIDRLDPALIRDGRFDLKIELKKLNKEIAEEMCNEYKVPLSILDNEIFPINGAYLYNKIFNQVKN